MTRQFRCLLVCCAILCGSAPAQLAGFYTVNPMSPTAGGNYASFADMTTALQTQGVAGPVTFQVFDDAGPFTEANPVTTVINPGTAVISIQGNLIAGLSAANRVTIEASPGERPVLDATGQNFGVQLVTTQFFTIKGLEIFGANVDGISVYADGASGATGALLGNEVLGNNIHNIAGCGINIYANLGGTAWFDGTIVRNNFLSTCQITNGGTNAAWRHGYVNERRSINAIIEHNSFYADTGVGTQFGVIASHYAPGIGGPAASCRNNLIFKSVANGALYYHVDATSIATVMDSNVYEDASGGSFMLGASGTFATLAAFQAANPTLETASLLGVAAYANPLASDLHLTALSSARDVGAFIATVTEDIDGDPRPVGSGSDAGADEFLGTTASIALVGTGCPGSQGIPLLSSTQLPSIGNTGFSLDVTNAALNESTYLFFTTGLTAAAPFNLPGSCSLYLSLPNLIVWINLGLAPIGPLPTGASGFASFPIPIPNDSSIAGAQFSFQAFITDPGASTGFTVTNAVECIIF